VASSPLTACPAGPSGAHAATNALLCAAGACSAQQLCLFTLRSTNAVTWSTLSLLSQDLPRKAGMPCLPPARPQGECAAEQTLAGSTLAGARAQVARRLAGAPGRSGARRGLRHAPAHLLPPLQALVLGLLRRGDPGAAGPRGAPPRGAPLVLSARFRADVSCVLADQGKARRIECMHILSQALRRACIDACP